VGGVEADWPITYQELAPFYDYVEKEMHVFGTREGLSVLPDGNFVAEAPRLRCSEYIARKRMAKLGMKLIPARKAVLLKGRGGRGGCHYCGHCMDVCDVRAVWSSDVTVIPEALGTGKLTLRMNALARQILIDQAGRVSGVSVIDRVTGQEEEIDAKLVIVSCAAIESARLLLNSTSGKYPNGLANSNDLVGRYLTGHTNSTMVGYLTDLVGAEMPRGEGVTDHAYIPRSDRTVNGRRPSYFGGFGMQLNYFNWRWPHHAKAVAGFGSSYKQRVRELLPAMFQMGAFGKVEARAENRVRVDPSKTDQFGIPIPIIKFEFSENDRAVFNDMRSAMSEILEACGTELKLTGDSHIGGFASHEVGTCRMGADPKQSVLNSYCQSHEVRNLFVVDGSCFTTFPEKNPTLTIAALAVRSARYIARQKSRGEL